MTVFDSENIRLYISLFHGRDDIYARRREKDGKSSYMPAYDVDWNEYNKHKAQGGLFKDFEGKKPQPFSKTVVIEHLNGRGTIGIYALLPDNTSWFIAADFDGEKWKNECLNYLNECISNNIPAYLERSRSGNGGHVWIFFEAPYPAFKSRKIIFELLRKAYNVSEFDKEVSFDRLFPNQDYHSKQGFGNLIALPLNGKSMEKGNAAFISPETFEPYPDQWEYLSSIQKLTIIELESLYGKFVGITPDSEHLLSAFAQPLKQLQIILRNKIFLNRIQLSPEIIAFLRDNLNFINSDYIIKSKIGKSTWKTEKYFKLIDETTDQIEIPRGFVGRLVRFCKEKSIGFEIIDERQKKEEVDFDSNISLYDYQEDALEITYKKDFGVIVAPPGSGKTIMGLELISRKQQPALIIVHRKQLLDQWVERIQSFLGIPKKEIGQIATAKNHRIGKKITIAMIQSLVKLKDVKEFANSFGTIIIDECHHIPAKTFREAIINFNTYYLYGLTATPFRKNNDEQLIFVYIGEILAQANPAVIKNEKESGHEISINIKETNLYAPFDYKIDKYETISKILIFDTARNKMIIDDIISQVEERKQILVLTERKEHINVLNLYLKERFETITISGDDPESVRKSKLAQIKMGHFQIVISTGQYFGEGIDIDKLDCLFLVYPFAFEGKLIQYIGRIQRSEKAPVIFDYRDSKIDYFEKLFKQRNRHYRKLLKRK
jgi:superfamily II DNA or RNA helicase